MNKTIAVFTIRCLLGLVFLMQGYGKVFGWGVENLYQMDFFYGTYESLLPDWLIYFTAYYTSYVELIGGAMLVVGLRRDWALYALASVLIIVTFGHGLATPIWDLDHVMFRAIFLVALLILPKEWDRFTLDALLRKYRTTKNQL